MRWLVIVLVALAGAAACGDFEADLAGGAVDAGSGSSSGSGADTGTVSSSSTASGVLQQAATTGSASQTTLAFDGPTSFESTIVVVIGTSGPTGAPAGAGWKALAGTDGGTPALSVWRRTNDPAESIVNVSLDAPATYVVRALELTQGFDGDGDGAIATGTSTAPLSPPLDVNDFRFALAAATAKGALSLIGTDFVYLGVEGENGLSLGLAYGYVPQGLTSARWKLETPTPWVALSARLR
ncbi:MAG: hypothetical protein KIT84_07330 [Labilithrix sp.]|nr:hypothetical protein [Labilithrix sp.]MCW5810807.1 hypothetical protein [Labilithrix sp.]